MTDTFQMAKAYDPSEVEARWYERWLEGGFFKPDADLSKPTFCIIMPPPNVTGELHLGHALTASIEDLLTRWHRMRGDATLWLPGRDHAGIAGQLVPLDGETETQYVEIATTRPETILADTAIAVHPEDPRYTHFHGREALVPSVNRPVPIVTDEAIEREFGTGALKVTPGHDPVDFE